MKHKFWVSKLGLIYNIIRGRPVMYRVTVHAYFEKTAGKAVWSNKEKTKALFYTGENNHGIFVKNRIINHSKPRAELYDLTPKETPDATI